MGKNIIKYIIDSKFNFKKALKYYKFYDSIADSNLFDENFYIHNYPDVNTSKNNLLSHYLFKGYKEGKFPSLAFDPDFYLKAYPDIKYDGMNPLVHFVAHGVNEGKIIQEAVSKRRKEEICETNLMLLSNYQFEDEPLVSIIILNRNGIKHLRRLFKDFSKKTNYDNYEIIVVDNDSSDESVDYLKTLKEELPIKIIENKENQSFSKSNNEAAKIANGEYLLLLNNDIEPTYGWLNEMVGTFLNNENVGAVGAKLIFPYYYNKDNKKKSFKIQHNGDIFAERMVPCCLYAINKSNKYLDIFDTSLNNNVQCIAVTGAVMLIKKSVYEEFGGLDEDYNYGLEDVDFSLKLYNKGYKIFYCGSSLLFHHESSTRVKSKDYFENDKKNYEIFWNKWGKYLSKNLLLDKLHRKKFFTEKELKIVIVNKEYNELNNKEFVLNLSKNLNSLGYEMDLITNMEDYYLGNSTDILLSFSQSYDLNKMICREDLLKVFLIENFNLNIDNKLLNEYDIVISSNKKKYNELKRKNTLKNLLYLPFSSYEKYTLEMLKNFETIINEM